MKIFSWNVNGIRSVYQKGFLEWFTRTSPDILCLQETRANIDQFPPELLNFQKFSLHYATALKKGYSGVATWSREKTIDTFFLEKKSFDNEGRTLIQEYKNFYLVNSYFPNGQRDHARVPFKLKYTEEIFAKVQELRKHKPVIITGDFNTAHHSIDLARPKSNLKTTGFLEIERAFHDKLEAHGLVDAYRHFHPEKVQYTWWSQRAGCREKNIGWRIDYFIIDEKLLKKVRDCQIHDDVFGSDHCPLSLTIEL
ncbi:MAG: exodeoxyribonuclease III [Proteobacteria bacterium]|nr:exodeoxyribonuclease III [Pseudomonadota bacterium]